MEKQRKEDHILNVTLIEPRLKHPTIFARFDALKPGEAVTIHNDHDPKPLYYQLQGERGNVFDWEYLEDGPECWLVRITRKFSGEVEETLGEIAARDIRKVEIFRKYGLDFCCGGNRTVREACAKKGLDVEEIEKELKQIDENQDMVPMRPLPFNEWRLAYLVDYIVNVHHNYVRKMIPDLRKYSSKVAKVHGNEHPELVAIRDLTEAICAELEQHMEKEERVLFPYIKKLDQANFQGGFADQSIPFSVQSPISMMELEHEMVAQKLDEIADLSHNYSLPGEACGSYTYLYKLLEDFEDDLHIHVHLENNILFPKAIELEKS